MNGNTDPCERIRRRRDSYSARADTLEDSLPELEAEGVRTDAIRARIRRLREQAFAENILYEDCLRHPPETQPTFNLKIVGFELTQAIQFFNFNGKGSPFEINPVTLQAQFEKQNSVPLIARKPTILRVYVDRTILPQYPIPTLLTGIMTYAPVTSIGLLRPPPHPQFTPINGPILAMPASSIDRGSANATLNFRLPAAYCGGWVRLTVTVFDPEHPGEPLFSSPAVSTTETFEVVPPMRVHGVLINYTGPNADNTANLDIAAPSGLDLVTSLEFVRRVYPIGEIEYTGCEVLAFNGDLTAGGMGCGTGWSQLLKQLRSLRKASHTDDVYVGLLPTDTPTSSTIGCGGLGGGVAAGLVDDGDGTGLGGMVLAQEIAHAFSRQHAPCGGPPNVDPNYPIYALFPPASIGEYGFDSTTSDVFDPSVAKDFMSYCATWTSPYTYIALKNGISVAMTPPQPNRASVLNLAREYLHLSVRIYRDGRVELLPSFHLYGPAPNREITGPSAPISCDLLDARGQIIDTHHFHFDDPHQDEDDHYLEFHETIPWNPAVQSIAFIRDGKAFNTLEVEKQPPNVRMLPPKQAGEREDLMRIQWTTAKPKKSITYILRYSQNGGLSWRAVAAGLTEQHHVVNLNLLPGGDHCLFQVVASAGIRTALAQTKPFPVAKKPRLAHILSPKPGAVFEEGTSIVLLGGGFSPDCGQTEFQEVVWSSNVDGFLGVGYQVISHTLSIGQHKISLCFPDGLGGEASAAVFIRVEAKNVVALSRCREV